jgi:hypothetical protein
MTNTTLDVTKVPGAVLVPFYSMFAALSDGKGIENQSTYMANEVAQTNATSINAFNFNVKNWTNDALAARDVLHTSIPVQPPVPLLKVFLRQDLPNSGGSWLAEVDGAPVGVYPPLPAPVAASLPAVTGMVVAGTEVQLSQDQKLDGIWADVKALKAALKAMGAPGL